jgi:hypothetical protein
MSERDHTRADGRKNPRRLLVTFLCASFALESFTLADTIWDQSPTTPPETLDITSFAVANDFEVSSPVRLERVTAWLGDFRQTSGLDGTLDNFSGTLGWAIFSNSGTLPGTLLFSGADTSPAVASTGQVNARNVEIFEVGGLFDSQPLLAPGRYWLSVRDGDWGSLSDASLVGWHAITPVELNRAALDNDEQNPTSWGPFLRDVDTTFALQGTVIPEPSTVAALLGMGAIGLAIYSRRRRRLRSAESCLLRGIEGRGA